MAAARMLDANANRAREALRVMEDTARFALNDAALSSEFKMLRHDLRSIVDALPPRWLESNRDTSGDVGTTISTPSESQRAKLSDVAIAAGKRLSESLRVMEEVCKTFNAALAGRVESLRYRAYTAEAALHQRIGTGRAQQWRVCVLLTESLCKRPWQDVLGAAVDNGADCIQVREKQLSDGELVARVQAVIEVARPVGASVIVNDRADIALAAGADGVHLGRGDLPISCVRQMAGGSLLIGASTHDLEEASDAVHSGADYCGIGAMFTTPLKPAIAPSGSAYLAAFIATYPHMPHLAIGGISPSNVHRLIDAGARGVAVSSCVCSAEDPGTAVRLLVDAVTKRETADLSAS